MNSQTSSMQLTVNFVPADSLVIYSSCLLAKVGEGYSQSVIPYRWARTLRTMLRYAEDNNLNQKPKSLGFETQVLSTG